MSTWTCYLCKAFGGGGRYSYEVHYFLNHAADLQAEVMREVPRGK